MPKGYKSNAPKTPLITCLSLIAKNFYQTSLHILNHSLRKNSHEKAVLKYR